METATKPNLDSLKKTTKSVSPEWIKNAARLACIRAFPQAPTTDIVKVCPVYLDFYRVNWINWDTGHPQFSRFVRIEDTPDGLVVEDHTIDS